MTNDKPDRRFAYSLHAQLEAQSIVSAMFQASNVGDASVHVTGSPLTAMFGNAIGAVYAVTLKDLARQDAEFAAACAAGKQVPVPFERICWMAACIAVRIREHDTEQCLISSGHKGRGHCESVAEEAAAMTERMLGYRPPWMDAQIRSTAETVSRANEALGE